jgi:hypothetical protein
MPLDPYVERWAQNPDGGGVFTGQRDLILEHDQGCLSLKNAWLPRRKGVSCPSDLMECETCRITFFWEGLTGLYDDCPESFWYFCRCCAEKISSCPCGGDCVKEPDAHPSGKPGGAR